jgi:hypothetical protein
MLYSFSALRGTVTWGDALYPTLLRTPTEIEPQAKDGGYIRTRIRGCLRFITSFKMFN